MLYSYEYTTSKSYKKGTSSGINGLAPDSSRKSTICSCRFSAAHDSGVHLPASYTTRNKYSTLLTLNQQNAKSNTQYQHYSPSSPLSRLRNKQLSKKNRINLKVDVGAAERDEQTRTAQMAEHCGEMKRRLRAHRRRWPPSGCARSGSVERDEQLYSRRAIVLHCTPERSAAAFVERVDTRAGLRSKWIFVAGRLNSFEYS